MFESFFTYFGKWSVGDKLKSPTAMEVKMLCSVVVWQQIRPLFFSRWQQGKQPVAGWLLTSCIILVLCRHSQKSLKLFRS